MKEEKFSDDDKELIVDDAKSDKIIDQEVKEKKIVE